MIRAAIALVLLGILFVPLERWRPIRRGQRVFRSGVRTDVLHFVFTDVAPEDRNWWLVFSDDGADLCSFDPGHPVTATVETQLRELTRIWRGQRTWAQAQKAGTQEIRGPSHVARNLPRWFPKASITVTTPPPGSSLVR